MIKIGNSASHISTYTCRPQSKNELKEIIKERITNEGFSCDLNDIDTSLIEDMSYLFDNYTFNGDISKWNVSNVKNMAGMFYMSAFSGDINDWDISNVKDMTCVFFNSDFNADISKWNINKNCLTRNMFLYCPIKEEFKPKSLQNYDQDRKVNFKYISLYLPATEQGRAWTDH